MHTNLKKGQQTRESGQTLILFTLFIVMLVLFVGLGIDLGFAYITRAHLSKSVDAACLMGLRNYSSTKVPEATAIADSVFHANYGTSGRDVGGIAPTPVIAFGTVNNNVTVNVSATTHINTFLIRVLPALFPAGASWQTLTVASQAQATRPNLILSLVLDKSGSMGGNGGSTALPPAVGKFIDLFDDQQDRASMSDFSYGAITPVTMRRPFKTDIKNAANAMPFNGWTASESGLTNGLVQNLSVSPVSGEKVIRAIVFFTDGMANTWVNNFDCGPRDISPDRQLWDRDTEASANSGCTVPNPMTSIDGSTSVNPNSCVDMNTEAQKRAEAVAKFARSKGIIIYSIGLGDPSTPGECGGAFPVVNPEFLKTVANRTGCLNHVDGQPEGDFAIAATAGELDRVFQQIASQILGRLTK